MVKVTISKRAAAIILFAVVLSIPGIAGASHIFTDVTDSNVHADGITWVADAGVTAGCGDGSTYCPNDPVIRAQMATFMHRLSGHAPGIDPSVNADQVDGLDASDLLPQWALVKGSDGSIIAQSGGISVIKGGDPVGGYYVNFGEDVTGRAILTNLQWSISEQGGMASVAICGGATDETVTCILAGTNSPDNVWVSTRDQAGALRNSDFYIAVLP